MRIVFFGTPYIAAEILRQILDSKHEIIALVTQPDRPAGRGGSISFSPAKQAALDAGIKILQPQKVADDIFLDELEALDAQLFVVAAYAQKLPMRLIEMPPKGCINVHPSLLPKYRGASPLTAAILNGDEKSGVTIMKVAEAMDAGDILMQEEMPLDPHETNSTITEKAIKLGGRLLLETIEAIEAGTVRACRQDDDKSTYVKQVSKEDGRIDFTESAAVIERKIRAFDPWPGTYTYLNGKVFKILSADTVNEPESLQYAGLDNSGIGNAGTVVYADKKRLIIATSDGFLEPLTVQLEGKKKMSMEEFLRGRQIKAGYKFG